MQSKSPIVQRPSEGEFRVEQKQGSCRCARQRCTSSGGAPPVPAPPPLPSLKGRRHGAARRAPQPPAPPLPLGPAPGEPPNPDEDWPSERDSILTPRRRARAEGWARGQTNGSCSCASSSVTRVGGARVAARALAGFVPNAARDQFPRFERLTHDRRAGGVDHPCTARIARRLCEKGGARRDARRAHRPRVDLSD